MAWLYLNQGQQTGPVDDAAFDLLVRQGIVRDDTLVWKDGMASWQAYSTVKPQPAQWAQQPAVVMNTVSPYLAALPQYRLFSPAGVALGAFFGTPVAGGFLMSLNYRRLGMKDKGWLAIAIGVGVTILAIALGYLIPSAAATGVGVGLVYAIRETAKATQGRFIDDHIQRGGAMDSLWVAFGIGLIGLVATVGAIFAFVFGQQLLTEKPKVVIGSKDAVYYSGTATKDQAKALGDALKITGFFADRGTGVVLSKVKGATTIAFLVQEGTWDRKEMVLAFEEIGRAVASSVGGFPIQVRLANAAQETKKEVTVGKVSVGKDDVFYMGSATESDAKGLGEWLKSVKYFSDKGATVLLAKNDGDTVITYIVRDGFWEDPAHVKSFELVTKDAAHTVGGLPITMRLANSNVEVQKEQVVAEGSSK